MKSFVRGLLMLFALAAPAWGQDEPAPDVTVEATKTGTPLDQMVGGVTILDAGDIKSMAPTSVVEVLRQVEGLDVVQSGGRGGQTSLFVRGGNSNHVLVLIDGVKVNSPASGAFDMAHLTVDQIERIEILRGPQSPLYGSEATSGVINIITKRGREGNQDSLGFEWGSYRTWRGSVSHSDRGPVWDQTLSLSRSSSQGISRANERNGNSEPDGYANTTFATRWGRGMGVGGRMDLSLRLTDATSDLDDYAAQPVDGIGKSRNKAAVVGLTIAAPLTPSWDHRLTLGWSRMHETTTDTYDYFLSRFMNSELDAQSRQAEWQHTISAGADNLLTLGYEYQHRLAGILTSGEHRLVTNGFYIQDQFAALDPLFFTAGMRTDDNSQFGRHNTYKVGTSLSLDSWDSRLFANYGTAFRGPTLNDLYYPFYANPDLEPERSKGYEVGAAYGETKAPLMLGATYFRTQYDDLITFNSATFLPDNINSAWAKGVEVTAAMRAAQARIEGTYTYTATRDGSTNDELLRRPRNKAGLALIFEPDQDSRLRLDYRWVGERLDFGGALPAYSVVNIAASQRMTNGELFLRLENALDREYEELAGYGTPGRSLYGGINVTF